MLADDFSVGPTNTWQQDYNANGSDVIGVYLGDEKSSKPKINFVYGLYNAKFQFQSLLIKL